MSVTKIVIIGAGFGGFAAAKALSGAPADIVLVDRTNYHLFQPLLYQVATAALSPTDIATPIRALIRPQQNTTIVMGEVIGVDIAAKRVKLASMPDLPYDYLIIATGAVYSFFGHPEWARHCLVLKTLEDAALIRSRLLGAFEQAETRTDPAEIRRLLSFVVIGGGPTGVELAGNIAELARSTLARDFRHIDPKSARVILVEAGPKLLAPFPPRLIRYAGQALAALGVEIRTGAEVTAIDADGLTAGGERIATANIFWAAGTEARPAAGWLGVPAAKNGAVITLPNCAVAGPDGVFVVGDGGYHRDAAGHALPGLAAVAKQQGTYVGRLIAARLAEQPDPPPFVYRDLGTLAVIGRSRAVAHLPAFSLTGMPAWLLWSLVHLFLLAGFRNRLSVYLNWSWSWITYGRGARIIVNPPGERVP